MKKKLVPPPHKLRCYCCGAKLGTTFALVHMQTYAADRVFVFLNEHAAKVEDDQKTVVMVQVR